MSGPSQNPGEAQSRSADALRGRFQIRLNGEPFDLPQGATVLDVLERLDRHPRTVAVEYNGDILPRPRYGDTELQAGDRLEIVHFVQGG